MSDPATGALAASAATVTSVGGMALLSAVSTIPIGEFIPGTAFACLGGVGWQFIRAQTAREAAEKNGVAMKDRPTIDLVTLGYSLFGAPLVAGALIGMIHAAGGSPNFLSLGAFILAGAAGPTLVQRAVALFISLLPEPKNGGK